MLIYLILLIIPALMALLERQKLVQITNNSFKNHPVTRLFGVVLILVIGLRNEVGADWNAYLFQLKIASEQNLIENLKIGSDPAYSLITWLAANFGGGIYLVNLVCSLIFTIGLFSFVNNTPKPWLALCVSIPYLVIVVAMGYTRQGVAIGLSMMGLVALGKNNLLKFILCTFFASLFHKSAVVMIPLAIFSESRSWRAFFGIVLTSVILFFLLIYEYYDNFISGYIEDQYSSSGAWIRVLMNAIPALLFLLLNKNFNLDAKQKKFWIWMSLSAILFIFLLIISPSSTAVDRLALYWLPLQLFIWSRLPMAIGKNIGLQNFYVFLIIVYTTTVQIIWLFYADNRLNWIPYNFFPWDWIWNK